MRGVCLTVFVWMRLTSLSARLIYRSARPRFFLDVLIGVFTGKQLLALLLPPQITRSLERTKGICGIVDADSYGRVTARTI